MRCRTLAERRRPFFPFATMVAVIAISAALMAWRFHRDWVWLQVAVIVIFNVALIHAVQALSISRCRKIVLWVASMAVAMLALIRVWEFSFGRS